MPEETTLTSPPPASKFDLPTIVREFRRQWLVIVLALAVCLVAAVGYLRSASYTYSVSLSVVPAQNLSGNGSNPIDGLASLAGVSLNSSGPVSQFDLYIEQLASRAVAERLVSQPELMHKLFAGEWNAARGRWERPTGFLSTVSSAIKGMLGLPAVAWQRPDAARLQDLLLGSVKRTRGDKASILTISIQSADPQFAAQFLTTLHQTTDDILRRNALLRSREYIDYIRLAIPQVKIVEQRAALASFLSEQEKVRMLASGSAPFAADILDPAHASARPTLPRPLVVLLGSILAGLALGTIAVLLRMQLRGDE